MTSSATGISNNHDRFGVLGSCMGAKEEVAGGLGA